MVLAIILIFGSLAAIGVSVLLYTAMGWQFELERDDETGRRMAELSGKYDWRYVQEIGELMGRPRKEGVKRDSSGKSRGEIGGIHPETIAVRERELRNDGIILHQMRYNGVSEVPTSTATDAKAGFTLGRLLLFHEQGDRARGINRKQYEAGDYWASLCRRHSAVMGYSLGVKSPTLGQVGGLSTTDPLEETVIFVRRQWSNAYNGLCGLIPDYSDRPLKLSFGVCVENWPVGVLTANDYGLLRIALNTIGQALDLGRKS